MKLLGFLLLVPALAFADDALVAAPIKPKIDLSNVVNAIGVPDCLRPCVTDVIFAADHVLNMENTVNNFFDLCAAYMNATTCISQLEMSCQHTSSFLEDSSAIQEICTTKNEEFVAQLPCLQEHLDNDLESCDNKCQFIETVNELSDRPDIKALASEGGDLLAFLGKMGPVCSSMGCMIACISKEVDSSCSGAGRLIADALLRPFITATQMSGQILDQRDQFAQSILVSECHYLIDGHDLEQIAEGTWPVVESTPKVTPTAEESEIDDEEQPKSDDSDMTGGDDDDMPTDDNETPAPVAGSSIETEATTIEVEATTSAALTNIEADSPKPIINLNFGKQGYRRRHHHHHHSTTAPVEETTEAATEASTEAETEATTEASTEAETEATTPAAVTEIQSDSPKPYVNLNFGKEGYRRRHHHRHHSTEAPVEETTEAETTTEEVTEATTEATTEAETEATTEVETEATTEAEDLTESTEAPTESTTEDMIEVTVTEEKKRYERYH